MNENRIEKCVFQWDLQNSVKGCWADEIRTILTNHELNNHYEEMTVCDVETFECNMKRISYDQWKNDVLLKPKLKTFVLYKDEPKWEKYITNYMSPGLRSYIAQFRLGILPLEVETGRYSSVPLEERLCKMCNTGEIEGLV